MFTYHSVDRDLESTDSRNDLVVRLVVVGVRNQLAVNFLHSVDLWNHVEDDFGVWDLLLDVGGN